jgi:hypothetical protein
VALAGIWHERAKSLEVGERGCWPRLKDWLLPPVETRSTSTRLVVAVVTVIGSLHADNVKRSAHLAVNVRVWPGVSGAAVKL